MPVHSDHVLALLIVFVLPLRAWWGMRTLNAASPERVPAVRARLWWRAIVMQWALIGMLALVWAQEDRSPVSLALVLRPNWGLAGVLIGLATIVSLVMRQRARVAQEPELQRSVREQLASVRRLMPHTTGSSACSPHSPSPPASARNCCSAASSPGTSRITSGCRSRRRRRW
jgi:hypothetical protein